MSAIRGAGTVAYESGAGLGHGIFCLELGIDGGVR